MNDAGFAQGRPMKLKQVIAIYLKSGIPVLIVFTIIFTTGYIFYGDEEMLVIFRVIIYFTLPYYVLFIIIGFPLLVLLYRYKLNNRITIPLVGLLIGLLVIARHDNFQFNLFRGWIWYLLFPGTGGLSGYYVYRLLNKKRAKT